MKYFFLLITTGLLWACSGQSSQAPIDKEKALDDTANYTTIEWLDSTSQDLGKVEQGQVVEIKWRFRNSGSKPLIVNSVRPGCGCTGAEGPEQPIAPGKEGEIKAKFDTKNYPGSQHKEVYMMANTTNRNAEGHDVLKFSVDVQPKQ